MKNKLTIGSDPEFVFYNTEFMSIVPHWRLARVTNLLGDDFATDDIGSDGESGESPISELRPQFSDSPVEHFKHIHRLVNVLNDINKDTQGVVSASAICARRPLGGHIHFGLSQDVDWVAATRKITRNLDYWLAPILAPLWNTDMGETRMYTGYANMGNSRQQPWGFEYRTLPSWLYNKKITLGVLVLAYIIADKTLDGTMRVRDKDVDTRWLSSVYTNITSGSDIDKKSLKEFLKLRTGNIEKLLENTKDESMFPIIKDFINEIPKLKNVTGDIIDGWGLRRIKYSGSEDKLRNLTELLGMVSIDTLYESVTIYSEIKNRKKVYIPKFSTGVQDYIVRPELVRASDEKVFKNIGKDFKELISQCKKREKELRKIVRKLSENPFSMENSQASNDILYRVSAQQSRPISRRPTYEDITFRMVDDEI